MDKKYCIFDMDGTLTDSMGYWQSIGREYLGLRGIEPSEELLNLIKPMTQLECCEVFIKEFALPSTAQAMADEMNAMMFEHYRRDVPLKEGVTAYLEALKRRGARLCTASATDVPLVRECLTRLGIQKYFDFNISCEEVGAGKHSPAVYLEAARRLGSGPEQTAVFEDSLFALKTARSAGFYTVACYDHVSGADWPELTRLARESVPSWGEALKALGCP